ncbi:MAG: hypothetical protein ABH860_03040 [bacterium]
MAETIVDTLKDQLGKIFTPNKGLKQSQARPSSLDSSKATAAPVQDDMSAKIADHIRNELGDMSFPNPIKHPIC